MNVTKLNSNLWWRFLRGYFKGIVRDLGKLADELNKSELRVAVDK